MKVRLGYVAIPLTLDITCSSTITYTNYQKLSKVEQRQKLDALIRSNLADLKKVLLYNQRNEIHFYRLTSKLLPLVTHEQVHFSYYRPYQTLYRELGALIDQAGLRLDLHPDQFAVLNSERGEVVENTFRILKAHHQLLTMLALPQGKLILHVGSSTGGKEAALKRFKDQFYKLPIAIQHRIVIENDDKVFDVLDVLKLCQELKVPMVLDYHHFLCNNKGEKIEDYLRMIFDTWKGTGLLPKIHFSSPKNKTKKEFRSHSAYIDGAAFVTFLKVLKPFDQDVDIMLEAKEKDRALFDLVRQLRYLEDYLFIDQTTFIV